MTITKFARLTVPWIITAVALYFAFRGVDLSNLLDHVTSANPRYLGAAVCLTVLSYCLRGIRWRHLFPDGRITWWDSVRVLVLGFFMNNILPARVGELVRAHLGARRFGFKRTLVLATIFSERLLDALVISLMFILLGTGVGDITVQNTLRNVALVFALIGVAVVVLLFLRAPLVNRLARFSARSSSRVGTYLSHRAEVFIHGLTPLTSIRHLPLIVSWSAVIWGIELMVFLCVFRAYAVTQFGLPECVLFLVAVNFSSLIPAAPGAIGVIEAVGKAVLMSLGVQSDELALTLVLTQHLIQYLVIGVPGAIILSTWRSTIKDIQEHPDSE